MNQFIKKKPVAFRLVAAAQTNLPEKQQNIYFIITIWWPDSILGSFNFNYVFVPLRFQLCAKRTCCFK